MSISSSIARAQTSLHNTPPVVTKESGYNTLFPTESARASAVFPGGATSFRIARNKHAFSQASAALSLEEKLNFEVGKAVFEKIWVSSPSSTTASDGLGPLYNARSCARCHINNGRGVAPDPHIPSTTIRPVSLFVRLSVPPSPQQLAKINKGIIDVAIEPTYGAQLQGFANAGARFEGRLRVSYSPITQLLSDQQVVTLHTPQYEIIELGYGPMHPETMISPRIAPPMIGLGLLDNIASSDIESLADPDDSDNNGISGRTRWVKNVKTGELAIGRFGWKGGAPTLEQQNAAALFHDIGIGSAQFPNPWGDCTATQNKCRRMPHGNSEPHDKLEASNKITQLLLDYTRHLAVPARLAQNEMNNEEVRKGNAIFHRIGCADCHRPSFTTQESASHPSLASQEIWPYTDLLLHDMGEGLADNRPEGNASGREWRTPPLWGLGFTPSQANDHNNSATHTHNKTRYLHDGRAQNLIEAILWHGGEALASANKVKQLPTQQRLHLIAFLESL